MAKKIEKLFRPEIVQQSGYHLESYPEAIKLNQNELSGGVPPQFRRELLRRWKKIPLERYPLVQPETLRRALAKKMKLQREQVLVANGSNVLIYTLLQAAALKAKVMGVVPAFGLYEMAAELLGNRFISVELDSVNFSFPKKKFLQVLKKEQPQVVLLANPNAPTGNLFSREDLLAVLRAAKGLVVVDEAYYDFSGKTLLPELKKFPNLVLMRTFSKGFGLGGARVGFLMAKAEVIAQVEKILPPYGVNPLSEVAALFALEQAPYYRQRVREVLRERQRVYKEMKKISGLEVFPSDANYLLFRVSDPQACFQFLLGQGVLIRDMSKGRGLSGCLRVSIGLPKENRVFLKALRSFFSKLNSKLE